MMRAIDWFSSRLTPVLMTCFQTWVIIYYSFYGSWSMLKQLFDFPVYRGPGGRYD